MTDFFSAHSLREDAEAAATAEAKVIARKKTRKYYVLGALAAVAIIPTAAYAVITGIIGSGTINGEAAAAPTPMTVTNGVGTPALNPGDTADITFTVNNANTFKVEVKTIEATGFTTNTPGCNIADFTTTLPVNGAAYTLTGDADSRTVPAKAGGNNGTKVITIPNAITLKPTATKSCAYSIPVTITGDQRVN